MSVLELFLLEIFRNSFIVIYCLIINVLNRFALYVVQKKNKIQSQACLLNCYFVFL